MVQVAGSAAASDPALDVMADVIAKVTGAEPGEARQAAKELLDAAQAQLPAREAGRATFDPRQHPRGWHGWFTHLRTPTAQEMSALADKAAAGGFTYRVSSQRSPETGFAFSPYPERSAVVPTAQLTSDDVRKFIDGNKDLLARPGHYLGAWRERNGVDRVWLDVSVVAKDRAEAERVGQQFNQIAAFDLASGREVALGGSGAAPAAARADTPARPRLTRWIVPADGLDVDEFTQLIKRG